MWNKIMLKLKLMRIVYFGFVNVYYSMDLMYKFLFFSGYIKKLLRSI